mmetsp:Transcript_40468/g.64995  ORF Transcript_40468/g.64995 Transcript_40468/m.64995 type:complete len:158 (+) Transcript_40468:155-628(+)
MTTISSSVAIPIIACSISSCITIVSFLQAAQPTLNAYRKRSHILVLTLSALTSTLVVDPTGTFGVYNFSMRTSIQLVIEATIVLLAIDFYGYIRHSKMVAKLASHLGASPVPLTGCFHMLAKLFHFSIKLLTLWITLWEKRYSHEQLKQLHQRQQFH